MIGVGNGGGGHVIAVLTDGTRTLIKWTCVCVMAVNVSGGWCMCLLCP